MNVVKERENLPRTIIAANMRPKMRFTTENVVEEEARVEKECDRGLRSQFGVKIDACRLTIVSVFLPTLFAVN